MPGLAPTSLCYWLCPFAGVDPPDGTAATASATFVCLHSHGEVRGLSTASRAYVVVVDAEAIPTMDYDPASMLQLLLDRIGRPPRYLVAVLKIGHSSLQSQQAFAAEMHRICGIDTSLVLEHAVGYVISDGAASVKAGKPRAAVQHRKWAEIAELAAALADGGYRAHTGIEVSDETERLVRAVLDDGGHASISRTDRRILVAIATARSAPDAHDLARILSLEHGTVRRRLPVIADVLMAPGDPRRVRNGWAGAFCAGIAVRHSAWLTSYAQRHDLH